MIEVVRRGAVQVTAALVIAGCNGGSNGGSQGGTKDLSPAAALGEKIFADANLSASRGLSCAGCHDPASGHADARVVSLGGPGLDQPGFRNAPSLRYLEQNPTFFFDGEGTPTGGFDRDGRAASLAAQARRPFFTAHEMALSSPGELAARIAIAPYADEFKGMFGANVLADPETTLSRAVFAIQQFELEEGAFHPYSSKYDAFLRGKADLGAQELRGLALYNSPAKGNCAACHPSSRGADGSMPLFTDFTYDNLGVPRNMAIPANADPAYFDLGLCGPERTDVVDERPDLCGAFKVPTLRNVAVTAPYFHNGRFATLEEALQFYVQRDTNPERFYPVVGGEVRKFDDLPPAFHLNVNTTEAPYNRGPGDAPALTDDEIDDVVAFLETLTDGFTP